MFIRTSKHWYIFGHVLVPCNTSDAPPPTGTSFRIDFLQKHAIIGRTKRQRRLEDDIVKVVP